MTSIDKHYQLNSVYNKCKELFSFKITNDFCSVLDRSIHWNNCEQRININIPLGAYPELSYNLIDLINQYYMQYDNVTIINEVYSGLYCEKSESLESLPEILMITLGRFVIGNALPGKWNGYIEFPSFFNVREEITNNNNNNSNTNKTKDGDSKKYIFYVSNQTIADDKCSKNVRYKLYALILHISDSVGSGHYEAIYNKADDDNYYLLNDDKCKKIKRFKCNDYSKKVYVLFYKRIDLDFNI